MAGMAMAAQAPATASASTPVATDAVAHQELRVLAGDDHREGRFDGGVDQRRFDPTRHHLRRRRHRVERLEPQRHVLAHVPDRRYLSLHLFDPSVHARHRDRHGLRESTCKRNPAPDFTQRPATEDQPIRPDLRVVDDRTIAAYVPGVRGRDRGARRRGRVRALLPVPARLPDDPEDRCRVLAPSRDVGDRRRGAPHRTASRRVARVAHVTDRLAGTADRAGGGGAGRRHPGGVRAHPHAGRPVQLPGTRPPTGSRRR